ncbi:hypothetical protein J7E50_12240 [Pedobacter sp. ISL-68]|uniref:hypothetical protein n=1 Tax=unclassified Pedobacter TaxID=2628915 RepID=UPI001BE53771|nr:MULTISPECIES: hypothetical protein [unclassified Pedobacter]MBT2561604.1 hypothetical protein [Pedobacter sp. ISL-64]MBT2590993.1 hypothetical protein [Pedobacter sp. ISL-68]
MELINKTTVFEENQVLTAGQLNTMQQFLFQESRLTRTRLIGIGIVCGLHATFGVNTVHISKGVGVTSWGFLISLGECDLTHFKPYTSPDALDYKYFNKAPLLELVTVDNAAAVAATPINASLILSDYVVVLFLESAARDLKSCLGKSCDDLGKENTFTVRKLLIKLTDLIDINSFNKNKGGAMYPALYNLETIEYPRALITSIVATNYPALINAYLSPVAAILEKLSKQLGIIYKELPALVRHFPGVDFDNIRSMWEGKLTDLSAQYLSGKAYGFQYVYDAFEDIIKSYEELRCIAMHLHSVCLPNEDAFPMHLMLGTKACPPSIYRQEFEYSPLFNEYKDWSKKLVSVFGRTLTMLNGYYDSLTEKGERGILATPSKEKWQNIGKRAFPIYFDPNIDEFEKYWNESLCHGCDNGKPLSYHYQMPANLQQYGMSKLEAPLLFNLTDTSFFRTEGHLAMPEDAAVLQYKKLQRRFNLPFKVRSIFMGEGGTVKTVCRYPDLDSQYLVWRNVMLYYLNNLIKYSTLAEKMVARFDDVKDAARDAVSGANVKKEATTHTNAAGMETFSDSDVNAEKKSTFSNINTVFIKAGMVNERINQANYSKINNSKGRLEQTPDDLQREALHLVARFNDNIEELIATLTLEFSDFDENRFKSAYTDLIVTYVSGMKLMVKIINNEGNAELMAYLMAATLLHRGLNVLMIRPYINIGTLTDIRSQRNKSLATNISFYDYIRKAGAVEHLAGVNKGNTLLLLYHTGKEIEYQTIGKAPEAVPVTHKEAEVAELVTAEKAIKANYEIKSSEIKARIQERENELAQTELQLKKTLESRTAEINKRKVLTGDAIKNEESLLKTELETKRKELKSTEGDATKTEAIEKEYKERVVLLRKNTESKTKEISELSKKIKSEWAEKQKIGAEEIEKARREETDAQKEYETHLAALNEKRKAVEKGAKEKELEEIVVIGTKKNRGKYLSGFEAKFNEHYDKLVEEIGKQGLENIASNVIADFTLYEDDSCCECDVKDYVNKELTPLVVPISRFVVYNQSRINTAKIQVLNNLYHPGEYKVIVKSDPGLGSVSFEEEIYEPKSNLKKQILVYSLDPKKVAENSRAMKSIIAVDELEYAIVESETGEEVGAAKITFFIGMGRITPQTYKVYGTLNGAQRYLISVNDAKTGAEVIKQYEVSIKTYSIDLSPGNYNMTVIDAFHLGIKQDRSIEIKNIDVEENFEFGKN